MEEWNAKGAFFVLVGTREDHGTQVREGTTEKRQRGDERTREEKGRSAAASVGAEPQRTNRTEERSRKCGCAARLASPAWSIVADLRTPGPCPGHGPASADLDLFIVFFLCAPRPT